MLSHESQPINLHDEGRPRRLSNIARTAGRVVRKLVTGEYAKERRIRAMSPEQRVDYEFDNMVTSVVGKHDPYAANTMLRRDGIATGRNGQRFSVSVCRSGRLSDQVVVEPLDGVRENGSWARTIYFGAAGGGYVNRGNVMRSTVDPTHAGEDGRAVRVNTPGDGYMDERGMEQLGQVLAATQWEPVGEADFREYQNPFNADPQIAGAH